SFRGKREFGDQVDATLAAEEERCVESRAWPSPSSARQIWRVASGAGEGEARHHVGGGQREARPAWRAGEPVDDLELLRSARVQLQKKAFTPASRIVPTWRPPASAGEAHKGCLIRIDSSSST